MNFTNPIVHTAPDPGIGGTLYNTCCEPAIDCLGDSFAFWCQQQGCANLSTLCNKSAGPREAARWEEINQLHHPFAEPSFPPRIPALDTSATGLAAASEMEVRGPRNPQILAL